VLFEDLDDTQGIAAVLKSFADLTLLQGERGRATGLAETRLALERECRNRSGIANALGQLGWIAHDQGNFQRAFALLEESLALQRELGDNDIAWTLFALGRVAYHWGDFQRAADLHEESLALVQGLGTWLSGYALIALGSSLRQQGERERADRLLQDGAALLQQSEDADTETVALALRALGDVASDHQEWARAIRLYQESLALAQTLETHWETVACLEGLAGVASGQNRATCAVTLWGAGEALRERMGAPLPFVGRSGSTATIAQTQAAVGDPAYAGAWTKGRTMTLEQTVAYAQEESTWA
jgi:tetratricopeptide (TPR) repeat protein